MKNKKIRLQVHVDQHLVLKTENDNIMYLFVKKISEECHLKSNSHMPIKRVVILKSLFEL